MRADLLAVDYHLALARDCFEVQPQPLAVPARARRDAERPPQPAHLDAVPRRRIRRIHDRAGPIRMVRTHAHIAPAAPRVDVPRRRNLDRRRFPAFGRRWREIGRRPLIAYIARRNRNRLKLPLAVEAQFVPQRLLDRRDDAILRREPQRVRLTRPSDGRKAYQGDHSHSRRNNASQAR